MGTFSLNELNWSVDVEHARLFIITPNVGNPLLYTINIFM
jgi:hypothetical protein